MPLPLSSSEILMRKCAGNLKISSLPAQTLISELGSELKIICMITGLKVDDTIATEFTKTFAKFILTHYGNLTMAEITLSFELNAADELPSKTVCYGSNLTIELIGGVLSSYKAKRTALATKIAHSAHPGLPEPELTEEEKGKEAMDFCNEYYRKWLERDFSPVSAMYAHMVYDTLDKQGLITLSVNDKKSWMVKAQEQREKELSAPTLDRQERKDRNRLMESYMNDLLPQEEKDLIKNYAKKLALLYLFGLWKEEGKLKLFE